MPRNKKSTKVVLGPRDIALLNDIFFSKVVDTKTIAYRHFKNKSYSAVANRLDVLFKGGYLRKIGLATFGKRTQAYSITTKAIDVIEKNLECKLLRKELSSDNVLHDLSLNHIFDRLKFVNGLIELKSENEIQSVETNGGDCKTLPFRRLNSDIYLSLKSKKEVYRFAVEYEKASKARDRWEEYLLNYHLEEAIDAVLYVCECSTILNSLVRIEKKLSESYSGKIYFITLNKFLSKEKTVTFENVFGHRFSLHFH